MKLKTLLLGSAATFAVTGGAQAADLSVAEPVEYVRVCDAFGVGYWYIPGTDTCLKIGGYVQFDVNIHENKDVWYSQVGTSPSDHSSTWDFVTDAGLNFTASSITEYGPLTAFIAVVAVSDNAKYEGGGGAAGYKMVRLDNAYLSLGPLLAGWTASTYDYGGAFTFDGSGKHSDTKTDQIRLSWAMSGFGLHLGIEDPRDRWGSSLPLSYTWPDLIVAITFAQPHWDAKISGGFVHTDLGFGWGVQAGVTIKLDALAPGDALRLKAAYADTAGSLTGGTVNLAGASWMALVSFQHFWAANLSSAISFSYHQDAPGGAGATWDSAVNLVWSPVSGFSAGIEGRWRSPEGWSAKVRLKRGF
jgi:hypothetical protein